MRDQSIKIFIKYGRQMNIAKQKTAGTFKVPQKALDEIYSWVRYKYCSNLLSLINLRFELLHKEQNQLQEINKNFRMANRVFSSTIKDNLLENETFTISFSRLGHPHSIKMQLKTEKKEAPDHVTFGWQIINSKTSNIMGSRSIELNLKDGSSTKNAIIEMREELLNAYDATYGILNEHDIQSDDYIVKLHTLKKQCLSYASTPQAVNKSTRAFNIDLDNWQYLARSQEPSLQNSNSHLKLDINVTVHFLNSPEKFSGMWRLNRQELSLFIDNSGREDVINVPENFTTILLEIKTTVRHELQHAMQNYFQYIVHSSFDSTKSQFTAGMPSRPISNRINIEQPPEGMPKDKNEPNRLLHSLRDVEFQTNLSDGIEHIERELLSIPKRFRLEMLKAAINPAHLPRFMINDPEDSGVLAELNARLGNIKASLSSRFFADLKEYEPQKYNRAAKEIFSQLSKYLSL